MATNSRRRNLERSIQHAKFRPFSSRVHLPKKQTKSERPARDESSNRFSVVSHASHALDTDRSIPFVFFTERRGWLHERAVQWRGEPGTQTAVSQTPVCPQGTEEPKIAPHQPQSDRFIPPPTLLPSRPSALPVQQQCLSLLRYLLVDSTTVLYCPI